VIEPSPGQGWLVFWGFFEVVTWPALLMDSWALPLPTDGNASSTWRAAAAELLRHGCASAGHHHHEQHRHEQHLHAPTEEERLACARLAACAAATPTQTEHLPSAARRPTTKPQREALLLDLFARSVRAASDDCRPAWAWPVPQRTMPDMARRHS
jgi:hypothetical protein